MNASALVSKAFILCGISSLAAVSYGSTLYLASSAAETTNNSGSATLNICPNPQWSSAFSGTSWVSNIQSGNPNQSGYLSPANGTTVTFTDTFTIDGTPTGASLLVMADDTASVTVDGILVRSMAPTAGNSYRTCSDFSIGCTTSTLGSLNILSDLHSGVNTISFNVEQLAGWSFGVDYAATITSASPSLVAASAAPEPSTLLLLSLPLIALSLIRPKKKA